MEYKIADKSEVEDFIIENMTSYFTNEIKIGKVFHNFGNPNIGKIHPFVNLLWDEMNGSKTAVLPAISISLTDDTQNDVVIDRNESDVEIGIEDIKELICQKYELVQGNGHLDKIKKIIEGTSVTEGRTILGKSIGKRYTQRMVIEVWADNQKVKDLLYEGIKDWIDFQFDDLINRGMENINFNGSKHGNYNFDFGKILYGGTVTLQYDLVNLLLVLDDETLKIAGVQASAETANFVSVADDVE